MDEVHKPGTRNRVPEAMPVAQATPPLSPAPAQEPVEDSSVATAVQDMPAADAAVDSGFDFNAPCAVGRGAGGAPFTISAASQRDLVRSLGWKSTACIWGGPALAVTCVYVICSMMGWL